MTKLLIWIRGMLAAAISGASGGTLTGFAAVGIDPQHLNLQAVIGSTCASAWQQQSSTPSLAFAPLTEKEEAEIIKIGEEGKATDPALHARVCAYLDEVKKGVPRQTQPQQSALKKNGAFSESGREQPKTRQAPWAWLG